MKKNNVIKKIFFILSFNSITISAEIEKQKNAEIEIYGDIFFYSRYNMYCARDWDKDHIYFPTNMNQESLKKYSGLSLKFKIKKINDDSDEIIKSVEILKIELGHPPQPYTPDFNSLKYKGDCIIQ